MGRILAIDPGVKRVGLALTDPLAMLASPYDTLRFTSIEKLVEQLKAVINEKAVETVVIGLPIREDNLEGPGCEFSREISRQLEEAGISTVLWDERYTSRMAEEVLRESGVKAKNMKDKIDKIAASFILDSYLKSL